MHFLFAIKLSTDFFYKIQDIYNYENSIFKFIVFSIVLVWPGIIFLIVRE